ncbi:hypothetical protein BDZ85DRAFT_198115 [Elsinoe ampelina]|uniref:CsbD-like domain-containing protein n=1 Tax=Elsinoe ampelina TaxID=302913 RepID=A0A6A6GBR1_9PEZI|nr:hypothetical protein BDZ85DRAFT_198115 [Elsinoe ampelina]
MSSNEQQPGLIGGHALYVKGAAEEAIGKTTSSPAWTESGATDKQQGVEAMKAASAQRDSQQQGYGKVEEVAGKVAGCEGMVEEGRESKAS